MFAWDAWTLFGLAGEALFFLRLIAQWTASERARRPVLPMIYWYFSIAGAAMVIVYALHRGEAVLFFPNAVGLAIYLRQAALEIAHRRRQALRDAAGFTRPDFAWPALSVIVPVHNEQAALAATLRNLRDQRYPGKVEIIAACNGCTDRSAEVARDVGVVVAESAQRGMSFGKNLGAAHASHDLLIFVDADTFLPADGLRAIVEALHGVERPVATLPGRPDRGGPVVRLSFGIANRFTRKRHAHSPGGVMAMTRGVYDSAGGFDESLPQGTSTDLIRRAEAAGATYVYIDAVHGTTSIRRFEKTGVIAQMWAWRKNHRDFAKGQHQRVAERQYDDIR